MRETATLCSRVTISAARLVPPKSLTTSLTCRIVAAHCAATPERSSGRSLANYGGNWFTEITQSTIPARGDGWATVMRTMWVAFSGPARRDVAIANARDRDIMTRGGGRYSVQGKRRVLIQGSSGAGKEAADPRRI